MTLKYKKIIWLALISLMISLVITPLVHAQDTGGFPTTDRGGAPTNDRGGAPTTDRGGEFPVETPEDILAILDRLINWMFTILLILAVIFILYAAYLFLTGGSQPDNIAKARNQLLFAMIAIAVGLVARGVEFLVRQLLER